MVGVTQPFFSLDQTAGSRFPIQVLLSFIKPLWRRSALVSCWGGVEGGGEEEEERERDGREGGRQAGRGEKAGWAGDIFSIFVRCCCRPCHLAV